MFFLTNFWESKFQIFSVITDASTDCFNKEQTTMVVQYVKT
jgi:hypothetical protein